MFLTSEFNLGTARGRIVVDSDTRGVKKAKEEVAGFERQTTKTSPVVGKLTKGVALLGAGAGVGLVAGFALSIKSAAEFQSKMSAIKADTGATADQIDDLRKLALRLGADTKFSAGEAADAIDGLAKAGIPIPDIMNGAARAVTDLAAAAGTDLATATDLAVSVMNQFHIQAKDMTKVVDLLTGAVNGSAADIGDFKEAMQQVGPVAAQAGLDVKDLAGFIAVLSNNGLKGSDAGTSLKTAITSLISPTSKAKAEMEKLGLITEKGGNQFIDAHGKLKPYDEVIKLLHDHLKKLSPAQRTAALEAIGGSDAMRALGIFTATADDKTKSLNKTLDNTSAAKTAKTRMDNLKGSIEQLKGSVETVAIKFSEKALPALKGLADRATDFVNAIGDFKVPEALKSFGSSVLKNIGDGLSGVLRGARDFGSRFIAALTASFGGGKGQTELQKSLSKIVDPKALANVARTQGREFGTNFSAAASTGPDWSGLGKSLADGIVTALKGIKNFGEILLDWVKSVNWLEAGKKAAFAAVPFIIGFVNNLVSAIIDFAIHHPVDMALFIISIIPIGRVAGIIGKLLEAIPFLRAFAPFFKGIAGMARPLENVIFKLIRGFGRFVWKVLERAFPDAAAGVKWFFEKFVLRILYARDAITEAAVKVVRGLGEGITKAIVFVVRAIGRVIEFITRPFRDAGGWLIRRGGEVVAGLVRGVRSAFGTVTRVASDVISKVTSPFAKAGSWLYNAGRNILSGLVRGGRDALKGIGTFLGEIKNAIVNGIKRLFGIHSPASVMIPLGINIIRGLIKGLLTSGPSLRKVLDAVGGNLLDFFGGVGSKIGSFFSGLFGGGGLPNFAALGKSMAASLFGWIGPQWNALFQLGMGESGWSNTADNPSSTAFGIGQFLDSTWSLVGMIKTSDPAQQILGMLKYIAKVYGDPIKAFSAWLSRVPHWYDKGGIWPSGTLGVNMSGRDEFVFTQSQMDGFSGGDVFNFNVTLPGVKDAAGVRTELRKRSTWDILIQTFNQRRRKYY